MVNGLATLDGALDVVLVGGFVPNLGDSFQILTYASQTGTFGTITGSDLGNGKKLSATYNTTDVMLLTIPS